MTNFQEKTNFLWSVADLLRDDFKRGKYQDVILPLTVLRRIDSVLEPTKEDVLTSYNNLKGKLDDLDQLLRKKSGYAFYNVSRFTWHRLLDDAPNLSENLHAYLNGFSPNMREVLEKFDFRNTIEKLDQAGLLYLVMQKFNEIDLHPDAVSNLEMGYIFEDLIRRFNEALNENPGEHFTPREIVDLMVTLLLAPKDERLEEPGVAVSVCDPCCGSGGMLTVAKDRMMEINPDLKVLLFGQEVNPETYAVCKSDLFLKSEDGRDAENIRFGSTLSTDGFGRKPFEFQLANPPYGKDWKKDKEAVEREAERGDAGRFEAGTPRISDGQLLFLQHMLWHMRPAGEGGGRVAIVMNGSPLFTGDAGSGESEIRRWILENDWLEAIVALPEQLFYNTGIATYVWILSNRKPEHRRNKVQLIDATDLWEPMRKSLGDKRREIKPAQIAEIERIYLDFEESDRSKIFATEDFGFRKIRVERPLRLNFRASEERIARLEHERKFANLAKSRKRNAEQKAAEEAEGRALQDGNPGDAPRAPRHHLDGPQGVRPGAQACGQGSGPQAHQADPRGDPRRARRAGRGGGDLPRQQGQSGAGFRPARLRERAAHRGRRGVLRPGGEAARAGRLDRRALPRRPRRRGGEGRLRDQLQPVLLRLRAAAAARGDRGGDPGVGEGDRRDADGGSGVSAIVADTISDRLDVPSVPIGGRIRGRKTYQEYLESDLPWIDRYPSHWPVARIGTTVLSQKNGIWGEEPIDGQPTISCVRVADFDRVRNVVAAGELTQRLVPPPQLPGRLLQKGDLLLEKSGGGERQPVGAVVQYDRDEPAICSNFIARMVPTEGHAARFLSYLHNHLYHQRVNTRSIKQSTGIQNLDASAYLSELVALPPDSEQHAIAVFLDRETEKIDTLIEKKKRLIELLEEKRTAMITRAVTKGLNPDVPMKDSGVAWLGEVPAHWTPVALRHVAISRCDGPFGSGLKSTHYRPEGVRVVRLQNIRAGLFYNGDPVYIDEEYYDEELGDHDVKGGDLLVAGLGDDNNLVGRACVAPHEIEPAMVKADCSRNTVPPSSPPPSPAKIDVREEVPA
jgi:type I restriction enzyme M protein